MKSASHNSDKETRRLPLVDWRTVTNPLLQQALLQARIAFPSDWSEGKLTSLLAVLDCLISKTPLLSNCEENKQTDLIEFVTDQLQLGHFGLIKLREEIGGELFCCALAFYAAATGERDAAIRFSEQAKAEALLPDAIRWRKENQVRAKNAALAGMKQKDKGAITKQIVLDEADKLRKSRQYQPQELASVIARNIGKSERHVRRILKETRT